MSMAMRHVAAGMGMLPRKRYSRNQQDCRQKHAK
jgi:hypothetical protein